MVEEEKKERKFVLDLNEAELKQEIVDLQQDQEVELFLKAQRGAAKFNKLVKLGEMLNKK